MLFWMLAIKSMDISQLSVMINNLQAKKYKYLTWAEFEKYARRKLRGDSFKLKRFLNCSNAFVVSLLIAVSRHVSYPFLDLRLPNSPQCV